jgi:hypothetical protein
MELIWNGIHDKMKTMKEHVEETLPAVIEKAVACILEDDEEVELDGSEQWWISGSNMSALIVMLPEFVFSVTDKEGEGSESVVIGYLSVPVPDGGSLSVKCYIGYEDDDEKLEVGSDIGDVTIKCCFSQVDVERQTALDKVMKDVAEFNDKYGSRLQVKEMGNYE